MTGAKPLRVALDATPLLGPRTGIGYTVAELLAALTTREQLELSAYAVTFAGRAKLDLPAGVRAATRAIPARLARRCWERGMNWPRIESWTGEVDVIHATNYVAGPSRAPTVVTVHDVTCVEHPEWCSADARRFPKLIQRALDRGAIVHTISETVANAVRRHFDLDTTRVRRIYPGLMHLPDGSPERGRALAGGDRYVLTIATIEPRKNLPRLIEAFDRVVAGDDSVRLVVAGGDGPDVGAFEEASVRARATVVRTGYVDDQRRADLLAGATAFAFPSLDEGFGHPPLEAMHAGVPVIAARAGSLPEVLGDAAVLVNPTDVDAIAAAIANVLSDEAARSQLIASGRERATRYSWTTTATELTALYEELAS